MNQNVNKVLGLLIAAPLALLVGFWVMTNPTGAISGLSKVLTVSIALITLSDPKKGLMFIIPQALYTDEIKRLAVVYGAVSYNTVYEVLLGPIISLCMLIVGYLGGVAFGRYTLSKSWIISMGVIALIGGAIFISAKGGFASRAQEALNMGLYMVIVPMVAILYKDPAEARKLITYQMLWAMPSIIWGIQQNYNGLSALEYNYAQTGLSAIHYYQVFAFEKPRPFGLFGSATGYSCVGLYGVFALYYFRRAQAGKVIFGLCTVVLIWAIIEYRARTTLIFIPLCLLASYCFYSKFRTKLFYTVTLTILLSGIVFAEKLLYGGGLDYINKLIQVNTSWGREVLKVNTFSDRLMGWILLGKSSTYTAFGKLFTKTKSGERLTAGDAGYHHDVITSIVINTGVFGLLVSLALVGYVIYKVHSMLLQIDSSALRREASMILGGCMTFMALGLTTGNVFGTTPLNFQLWTSLGVFCVLCNFRYNTTREKFEKEKPASFPSSSLTAAAH